MLPPKVPSGCRPSKPQRIVTTAIFLCIAFAPIHSAASSPDTVRAPTNSRVVVPAETVWSIPLPQSDMVSFRGQVDQDKAGTGPGAMLYPAPGLAGFLVAVALHGALQSSALSAQQRQMQEDADKVLLPYRPLLDGFRHRELFDVALAVWRDGKQARLIDSDNATEPVWRMRVDPSFTMTQDQSALILYATIAVTPPANPTSLAYTNVISVVLRPLEGDNLQAQWSANEGRNMRDAAGRMLAEAMAIAVADMTDPVTVADSAFRTLRYREGTFQRIERAAVISQRCERWVIRNLRGWIKSVPVTASANKPSTCHDALRIAASSDAATVTELPAAASTAAASPSAADSPSTAPSNNAPPAN